jgi:hypothetical protein
VEIVMIDARAPNFFRNGVQTLVCKKKPFAWQAKACTPALCDNGLFKLHAEKNVRSEDRVHRNIKRLKQTGGHGQKNGEGKIGKDSQRLE